MMMENGRRRRHPKPSPPRVAAAAFALFALIASRPPGSHSLVTPRRPGDRSSLGLSLCIGGGGDVVGGRREDEGNGAPAPPGIRLNKVFKATHSRRESDRLIESGRVTVNGVPVTNRGGIMVIPYRDEVALDGRTVLGWEGMNAIAEDDVRNGAFDPGTASFEYVKYFKPRGCICTTDSSIRGNIIGEIRRDGYAPRHRVYPVGRLDKETTGLIILTSDGRVVNAFLRGERKQPKVYKVMVNGRLTEGHLQRLRDGVVIRTVAQRKGKTEEENTLVAKTRPCGVERLGPSSCQMTLVEGRNRQIRRMMEAIGFRVVRLHRLEFAGIGLGKLKSPGDWARLDRDEMRLVEEVLLGAAEGVEGA